MKTHEFCYWLQGLFEIADPTTLNENQVRIIKAHLDMVFLHDIDKRYPAEEQAALNGLHNGLTVVTKTPAKPAPLFEHIDSSKTLMRC